MSDPADREGKSAPVTTQATLDKGNRAPGVTQDTGLGAGNLAPGTVPPGAAEGITPGVGNVGSPKAAEVPGRDKPQPPMPRPPNRR